MKDYSVLDELVPKTEELHRAIFDKAYEQGLDDAWVCARKIETPYQMGGIHSRDVNDIFGCTSWKIMRDYTASEAIEKIKAWEQKKEQPKCELANCICPYEIDCDECEVFCSVKRARQRAKEKE